MCSSAIEQILQAYFSTISIQPKYQMVKDLLTVEEEINYGNPPSKFDLNKKVNGQIIFDQVTFTYPENRGSIQNVTFTIGPGEFVGIVGSTGGGKTTMLQDNLEQLFEGKTVIVVAHRLATIRNADRIMVVDQGKVVEMGTHRELIDMNSLYYQLYSEQFHTG